LSTLCEANWGMCGYADLEQSVLTPRGFCVIMRP
jgi:hypothetical protein